MQTIYVRRSDGVECRFDGMSLDVVMALLDDLGLTGTVIPEVDYQAVKGGRYGR